MRKPKQYYDEYGNIVQNLSEPYFYYYDAEEQSGWNSPENAEFPHSKQRVAAKDNSDFLITENDDEVCINEYVGKGGNVVIPDMLNGKKVTKIGGYTILSEDGESTNFLPAFNTSEINSINIRNM